MNTTTTNNDLIRADADEHEKRARAVEDMIKKADEKVDLGRERSPGENGGQHLDKMLATLDACAKAMDSMSQRLDALEAHHKDDARRKDAKKRDDDDHDDDDDGDDEHSMEKGERPGEAKEVVADSNPRNRAAFADAQESAEKAYLPWGTRAPAPLYGERLRDYRIRLLRPLLKHSKQFAKSDLESVTDTAAFDAVEQSVYGDSISASSAPDSVPRGQLRMITKRLPSGHTINEFVGEPQAWMDRFASNRRFVVRLNTRWGGSPTE
jgi:hypothetical protein